MRVLVMRQRFVLLLLLFVALIRGDVKIRAIIIIICCVDSW